MFRRSVVALGAALLLAGSATGDPGSEKARVDSRIGDLRAKADQAAGTEGVLTTELSRLNARSRAAEAAVVGAQARLSTLESSLAAERARLEALTRQVADQSARLIVLERQYRVALAALEQRLRAIYEADSPDLVAFALGTTSFADLLDHIDLLSRIGKQDERIASSLDGARTQLGRTRRATERAREGAARSTALIAARTEVERQVRDRLVADRDALANAESDKAQALEGVRGDRATFVAEAESLAAQSAALAATIAAAQSASQAAPTSGVAQAAPGGGLAWPVAGPVTSGFGTRWGHLHAGIDIAVPTGTPVHAAAAGTVIFAGWLDGYGNLVVIDHGDGISTAYGHNSSLAVTQGAAVGNGAVVALSGSTGHSTGPHVHFEVRINGAPVDPLAYL